MSNLFGRADTCSYFAAHPISIGKPNIPTYTQPNRYTDCDTNKIAHFFAFDFPVKFAVVVTYELSITIAHCVTHPVSVHFTLSVPITITDGNTFDKSNSITVNLSNAKSKSEPIVVALNISDHVADRIAHTVAHAHSFGFSNPITNNFSYSLANPVTISLALEFSVGFANRIPNNISDARTDDNPNRSAHDFANPAAYYVSDDIPFVLTVHFSYTRAHAKPKSNTDWLSNNWTVTVAF